MFCVCVARLAVATCLFFLDLSDPFCVFGLVEFPPNYLDGKSKTKKLKKLVKDESQLRQTRVIEKTLNPEWNETFNMYETANFQRVCDMTELRCMCC